MRIALFLMLLGSPVVLTGCGEPAEQIRSRQVTVACGTCIFRLPNGQGCYWAVELEGKQYPVMGAMPEGHEMHSPTGMCNMPRTAIVDGELSGNTFIATRFELQPAAEPAAEPAFTEDDVHGAGWDATKMK